MRWVEKSTSDSVLFMQVYRIRVKLWDTWQGVVSLYQSF